jgi:hypothetical protein
MVSPKLMVFVLFFLALLSFLFTVFSWLALPEYPLMKYGSFILCLVFCLTIFFYKKSELEKFYKSYWFKNFSSAFIFVFLLFCILSLINYLSFKHPSSLDLTSSGSNSLSDKTKQVLSKIAGPVEVIILAKKEEIKLSRSHLELYRLLKNDFKIEEFDIDLRPDLMSKYEINSSPNLIFKRGDKVEIVNELTEKEVSNALIRLNRTEIPKIYLSIGHQEVDFEDSSKEGASLLAQKLIAQGYELLPLQLGTTSIVPADASLVLILGPRVDFSSEELKVLDQYLERGGKSIVALDPNFIKDRVANLRQFLKNKGIIIENDMVVDTLNNAQGSSGIAPIVKNFSRSHEATKNFDGIVFFPLVSSVRAQSAEVSFHPLALSGEFPSSWAEKNLKEYEKGALEFHPGVDAEGPATMIAQVKNRNFTMIIMGNSNFIINGYAEQGHNQKLFSNLTSYLLNEKELLSFDAPETKKGPVIISELQLKVIFFFSVLFSPIILSGVSIYMYRRVRV